MDLGNELKNLPPAMDVTGLVTGMHRKRRRRQQALAGGLAVAVIAAGTPLAINLASGGREPAAVESVGAPEMDTRAGDEPDVMSGEVAQEESGEDEGLQAEQEVNAEPMADYPYYSTLEELLQASDVVLLATATDQVRASQLEAQEPDDPTDPKQNPTLGVPDAEPPPPIPVQLRTLEVGTVIRGEAPQAPTIDLVEYPGSPLDTAMLEGAEYLLFLSSGRDGVFHLVTPLQGMYVVEDGTVRDVVQDPYGAITLEQLEELVAEVR